MAQDATEHDDQWWGLHDAGWDRVEVEPAGFALAGDGTQPPQCERCGQPVRWRDLRWSVVTLDSGDGTRVSVEPEGPAVCRQCGRRLARGEFVAWVGAAVGAGRVVGRSGLRVGRATVVGWRDFGVAVAPVVAPLAEGLGRSGRRVVRLYGEDARRWVRRLPLERIFRPVGAAAGAVLRAGRVGHSRGREADHHDPVGSVVAPDAYRRWGFRFGAGEFRPVLIRWDGNREDSPPAGQAGPTAGTVGAWVDEHASWAAPDEWQRKYLDQWFGAHERRDVDTPRDDNGRR